MTECDKFKAYYSSYIEGDIFPEQKKSLEAHLSICPPCQKAVHQLRLMCDSLRSLPILTTSGDFEYKLHQQIANLNSGHLVHIPIQLQNWKLPAVATLAVVVMLGIFIIRSSIEKSTNADIPTKTGITNPVNMQKSTEDPASPIKGSPESPNRSMVSIPKDSIQKDTGKDNREDGLKLVDEK